MNVGDRIAELEAELASFRNVAAASGKLHIEQLQKITTLEAERARRIVRTRDMARRIREWYATGRKGLATLATKEGMSLEMVGAIEYWFKKGDVNLTPILRELEREL